MRKFRLQIAAVALVLAPLSSAVAQNLDAPSHARAAMSGVHDFDFEFGEWRVHHRIKSASGDGSWTEFDGTSSTGPILGGSGNVEDNVFHRPTGLSRGVAVRLRCPCYAMGDLVDRRALSPRSTRSPMIGRFENGIGTFYSDTIVDGASLRTRFIWSHITTTTARWEQALSRDTGATWETNWVMEFRRQ